MNHTLSNREAYFASVYEEMGNCYRTDELERAVSLCHYMIKYPELPIFVRGGCYVILASLEPDYLFWARSAVKEYQFGMDEFSDAEVPPNEEVLERCQAIFNHAKQVLEEAERRSERELAEARARTPEKEAMADAVDDVDTGENITAGASPVATAPSPEPTIAGSLLPANPPFSVVASPSSGRAGLFIDVEGGKNTSVESPLDPHSPPAVPSTPAGRKTPDSNLASTTSSNEDKMASVEDGKSTSDAQSGSPKAGKNTSKEYVLKAPGATSFKGSEEEDDDGWVTPTPVPDRNDQE